MLFVRLRKLLSPILVFVLISGLLGVPLSIDAHAQPRTTQKRRTRKKVAQAKPTPTPSRRASRTSAGQSSTPGRNTSRQTSDTEQTLPTRSDVADTGDASNALDETMRGSIRADLPPGGELRVENRRGTVSVEVWNERHVAVAATVEGQTPRRSPVIIQRTEKLLTVSVARQSAASSESQRVDLRLRIPERSRTEIVTSNGDVELIGVPAALSVATVEGNVRAEIPTGADARVRAETTTGTILSAIAAPDDYASERIFEARMGRGTRPLRLRSEKGQITLAPAETAENAAMPARTQPTPQPSSTPRENSSTQEAEGRRPPALQGIPGSTQTGAGTPAGPDKGPQEIEEDDVIRVDTELVTLNMSVVDRGTNRGLTGLVQGDFKLYEDGAQQEIAHFESSSAPFNMVLLIDLSGSTKDKIEIIRTAAMRFTEAARRFDSIAVITFAGTTNIVSRLTTDRALLRQRISAMETLPGDTKLYDSVDFAMKEVLKDTNNKRRTAVVVMSDGLDGTLPSIRGDGSLNISYQALLNQIREFDGVMYALWLNTEYESLSPEDTQPEDFDAGHDRMQEMAETGGGLFYEVDTLEDLAGTYERVVADLGTVYSLSYRPTNKLRDGKWRAIRVNIQRPNAVARGKRGYYAN
jgi:VWFA-related protein